MDFLIGGSIITVVIVWLIALVLLVGWIKNIIKIVKTKPFISEGMMIVRIIGIFIPIIGGVIGYF